MSQRKVIQIASAAVPETGYMEYAYILTALCEDGTMWECVNGGSWQKLDGIPLPTTGAAHE